MPSHRAPEHGEPSSPHRSTGQYPDPYKECLLGHPDGHPWHFNAQLCTELLERHGPPAAMDYIVRRIAVMAPSYNRKNGSMLVYHGEIPAPHTGQSVSLCDPRGIYEAYLQRVTESAQACAAREQQAARREKRPVKRETTPWNAAAWFKAAPVPVYMWGGGATLPRSWVSHTGVFFANTAAKLDSPPAY